MVLQTFNDIFCQYMKLRHFFNSCLLNLLFYCAIINS